MSGISSGVGLISGINTADLIDKLMQIEARPVTLLQSRLSDLSTEKAAWMSLSASLLGLKSAVSGFDTESAFQTSKVASSDATVLAATSTDAAQVGSYQFTVRQLAQTHQLISGGFTDSGDTAVGAGTITIDDARSRLDGPTRLESLNGGSGVRRGTIRLTDRSGASSAIDLSGALTVNDVLDAINNDTAISVHAEAQGDRLVLTDTTGLGTGTLSVAEVGGGHTAGDLGILGSATDAPLTGSAINTITASTALDLLNDGNGISRSAGMTHLAITRRDGLALNVNLDTARTVGDVLNAINNHVDNVPNGVTGEKLTAAVSADGLGITLTDASGAGDLVVADGVASAAATELGIAGTFAAGPAVGRRVVSELNSVLLSNLFGGLGATLGSLSLQDRSGASASVDLTAARSVSDVLDAINSAGVGLSASLNGSGMGITITDTTGLSAANLIVADAGGGDLAAKLGIAVDAAVSQQAGGNAEHRYVSTQTLLSQLNHGEGIAKGKFTITNSMGVSATVDASVRNVVRVDDLLRAINTRGIGVTATVNASGTGILLTDTNSGALSLKVAESGGGTTAADLGLLGQAAAGTAIIDGSYRRSVTITATDTLDQVAEKLNDAGAGVTAGVINDGSSASPFRLLVSSASAGSGGNIVFDAGATGLNLTTFVEGRDAVVYLGSPGGANPIALTTSTNQLSGVLPGVTVDLLATSTRPVTLTVSRDTDALVTRMKSFADGFNSIINNIGQYIKYDSETQQKGVLFGDASVWNVRTRLTDLVTSARNVGGSYTRLSQVGFTLGSGNTLTFDEDKFRAALTSDPQGVLSLFTEATSGIGPALGTTLDGLTDSSTGTLADITGGLDSQSKLLNDRITQLNVLLDAKRTRLERQFMAMETALAGLQSQQNALTSLSQIAASFSGSSSSSSSG